MYICLCADKCEDDIKELLNDGITDIETIKEITEIGSGCGTCKLWIEKFIEEHVQQ